MKYFCFLILLVFIHTFPLWNVKENLAGRYGDPFAHAAIGEWYCKNVVTGDFQSDIYLSPHGTDFSGNYDSPFPFILTCPFVSAGPHFQFHLFTVLQVLLIVISSFLLARIFIKRPILQFAYVLFVWWCGYYISRSHQHMTLLSNIWGFQFLLYAFWSLRVKSLKSTLISGLVLALSFTGTFQNLPSFSILSLCFFILFLWQNKFDVFSKPGIRNFSFGFLIFASIFAVLWGPMIAFTLKYGTPQVQAQRHFYNLDLLSPLVPFSTNIIHQWFEIPVRLDFERFASFDLVIFAVVLFSIFFRSFWRDPKKVGLLILGGIYFVLALGPELRINNDVYMDLPINQWLFETLPLSLTRTPARLALVSQLCLVVLAFLFLDQIKNKKLQKVIPGLLILWVIVTGPMLNNMAFFPSFHFQDFIPMKGLEALAKLPEDTTIVQIPSAWAQDPSQNFHRLFHGHSISAGYLAYPVYNRKVAEKFVQDPILGKLGCRNESTSFSSSPVLENFEFLREQMKNRKLRGVIINKQFLVGNPDCRDVLTWVQKLIKNPWIHVVDDNAYFLVAEVF